MSFSIKYTGTSMYPYLEEGDTLVVQESLNSIKAGSLVLFKESSEHQLTVHRCISRYPELLIKGDRNLDYDEVNFDSVLGHVVGVKRGEKSISYIGALNLNRFLSLCSVNSRIEDGISCRYLHQLAIYLLMFFIKIR